MEKKIGYVGQDPILMNDTILNNITFRDESISSQKVDEVIKLSSLQGMIKILLMDYLQLPVKEVSIYQEDEAKNKSCKSTSQRTILTIDG